MVLIIIYTIWSGVTKRPFSDQCYFKNAYLRLNLSKLRGIESRDLLLTRYCRFPVSTRYSCSGIKNFPTFKVAISSSLFLKIWRVNEGEFRPDRLAGKGGVIMELNSNPFSVQTKSLPMCSVLIFSGFSRLH